ncbi:MAG: DUF126 domain-containing protein [Pseudomonadota bacterium]
MTATYWAARAMGPRVIGEALVATDGFSARYDLDRLKGIFSRPSHRLFGQSYVGKILILDRAKGGVASAWMFNEMVSSGLAPAALVMNRTNPVLAQGAALAGLALLDGFDQHITALVESGAQVEVDPDHRTLKVLG